MGSVRIGVLLLAASRIWAADSALTFAKAFGGSGNESIGVVATDAFGNVVVAGSTSVSYTHLTLPTNREV